MIAIIDQYRKALEKISVYSPSTVYIYTASVQAFCDFAKNQLASDPEVADERERCSLYLASWGRDLDRAEYDDFGPEGCGQFDPEELSMF